MGFFRDLKNRVRGMQNQMQGPILPQMPPPFMRRRQAPGTVLDLETGLPPVRLPEITENIGNSVRRLPQIMPERRMPQQRPSNRFFGGGLGNIFSRLPNQRVRERMSPPLPRAPLPMPPRFPRTPMPMPEKMPMERFPMMRPGFAEGEDVDMNMIIAEQAAREGISPAERRTQSIKNFIKESNRIISDRDAELFGMGVLSFEDVMRRAESARQTNLANEQRQNAIANQGRTISNMDRNLMQQEQMFFPQSDSLDDILEDLEKKN
jgi:hypothetical protein